MVNYYEDHEDLRFYIDEGLEWRPLVHGVERSFGIGQGYQSPEEAVEAYEDMLKLAGKFVGEQVAPHTASLDKEGVQMVNGNIVVPETLTRIFEQMGELGLYGMCLPRELGGMNCPNLLHFLTCELLARADASLMTHYAFHGPIAMTLLIHSITEGTTTFDSQGRILHTRFEKEISEIVTGQAWGCMDITEPQAGSDMAALTTYGQQDAAGQWRITGTKIFLTSGHGKYHVVIARTEDSPGRTDSGLKGLSLFLVPLYEETLHSQGSQSAQGSTPRTWLGSVDRLEDKLGHHASVTCAVHFDHTPAQLIGQRGEGFKYMLLLMNNARLTVGFEGLGMGEAAYRMARGYAAERTSMGKTLDQHEMIADYLDEMHTDLQALRALVMEGAYQEEISQRLRLEDMWAQTSELETQRRRQKCKSAAAQARHITPLVKYMAAEKAVEMARRCIQIHGGLGYMKDCGAEKLLRDAMVLPIYEGTSQIQALMAMKDNLTNVMRNPQGFVKNMAQTRWRSLSARDPLERRTARIQQLCLSALQSLLSKTAVHKLKDVARLPVSSWPHAFLKNWNPKRDLSYAMLHAERLTRLMADAAVCRVLHKQAKKHSHRRSILERYLDRAEPRCRFLHDEITTTGQRMVTRLGSRDAKIQTPQADSYPMPA